MADPVSVTQYQTGFAPEVAPFAQDVLGSAQALTSYDQNPYQKYTGDQVAQFSPLQQQSYDYAKQMTSAPQLQDATSLAGMAGLGGLNAQYTFKPSDFGSTFTKDAQGNLTSPLMNPFTDVMDASARRNAAIAQQQQQAQAAQRGAFGGSGDLLMRNQGNAELQRQLGQNQFNAYNQAQQQYNTQNQQNAQQQQFGANLGMQGLQTALTGANALGSLGQTQFAQNVGLTGLQNQLGLQQQQQAQNVLNTNYQNFMAEQNDPYKRLGFYSDIVRGAPLTQTGSSVYQAAPTGMQNLTSLGLGAYGLSSLFGTPNSGAPAKAAGGAITGYASGGSVTSREFKEYAVDNVPSQMLPVVQRNAQARGDMDTYQLAMEQMAQDAAMRRGIASAMPPGVDVVRAAGGGILAFDEGGKTPKPKVYTTQDLIAKSMGYEYSPQKPEEYQAGVTNRRTGLQNLYGENEVDPLVQQDITRRQAQIENMSAQTNPLIALRSAAALQKSGVTPGDRWGSALSTVAEGAEKAQANKTAAEEALMKAKIAGAAAKQARKDGFTDKAMGLEDIERKNVVEGAKFNAQAAGQAAQVLGHIDQAKITAASHAATANKPTDLDKQRSIIYQALVDSGLPPNSATMAKAAKEASSDLGRYPGEARAEAGDLKNRLAAVDKVEIGKLSDPVWREAKKNKDTAGMKARENEMINSMLGKSSDAGAPNVAPPAASAPAATSSPVSVKAPNGQVYNFPDQKSANAFKAAAGIK